MRRWPILLALAALASACGVKRVALPADPGTPLADFAAVHADISRRCLSAQTLTAEIGLSGRAGGERLRGTIHAGFKRPGSMRLEFRVSPFGGPAFELGDNGRSATLLIPRDEQVVRHPRSDEILAALTGLTLSPADLMAILTGCVVPSPQPIAGRTHTGGWTSIALAEGATLYLRRAGDRWQLAAAQRGNLRVDYPEWPPDAVFPARVLLTAMAPVPVTLTASLRQVDANEALGDDVFEVNVPASAETITIEDLRRAGPLREGER